MAMREAASTALSDNQRTRQVLCANSNYLQKLIFWSISVIFVMFVFEESLYGRLNLNNTAYLAVKTISELYLYALLLFVALGRIASRSARRYKITVFDYCMLLFVLMAIVSTLINDGSIFAGALNVRTMLRYVAIYYIIVFTLWSPTEQQAKKLIKLLLVVALIQSFLAIIQHIGGDEFRDHFFSPLQTEIQASEIEIILNANESKLGVGYGTFGKPAAFSIFLLFPGILIVIVALASEGKKRLLAWLGYCVILLGVYFSYKRGTLVLMIIAPFVVAWFYNKRKFIIKYLIIFIIGGISVFFLSKLNDLSDVNYVSGKQEKLSPVESISQLFSEEYWTHTASVSRGWFITEVGGEAVRSLKVIGYGADALNAQTILASKGGSFSKLVGWNAFEDVYIVAIFIYYGIMGLLLLAIAFAYLYRTSKRLMLSAGWFDNGLAVMFCTSILLVIPGLFLERIFEFRAFAFLFWVLAGLTVVLFKNNSPRHRLSTIC